MRKIITLFLFSFCFELLHSYPIIITFADSKIYSCITPCTMWQNSFKASLDTSIMPYSHEKISHTEYQISDFLFDTVGYEYSPEYPELIPLGVEPEVEVSSSNFIYRVKYQESSNEFPKTGYPKLIVTKDNIQIEGSPFDMKLESGEEPKTGLIYSCTAQLIASSTNYSFYFIAYVYEQYDFYIQTEKISGPVVIPPDTSELKIIEIDIGGINFNNETFGISPYIQPVIKFNKKINITKNIKSVEIHSLTNGEIISGDIIQTEINQIKFLPDKPLLKAHRYKLIVNYEQKNHLLFFNTVLDFQIQNTVIANNEGKTKIKLEKNTLNEDGFIIINTEPTNKLISESNQKLKFLEDRFIQIIPETETEFLCFLANKEKVINLNLPAEIFIPYVDNNSDGIVDNSSPKIISKTLKICRLNEETAIWEEIPSSVDEKNCLVSAKTNQLGIFSIIGKSYKNIENVYAYPVPFEKEKGHQFIKFGKNPSNPLPSECKIRIYTISGELVKELEEKDGDGIYVWQKPEDNQGRELSSGVYIYIIDNGKSKKYGKIMIIK